MRRSLLLALVPLTALVAGCAPSSRDHAHDQFVQQFETQGHLTHDQAVCVVDKFFAGRSDAELKAFFERKDLTAAESAEFAALGQQCSVAVSLPAVTSRSTSSPSPSS